MDQFTARGHKVTVIGPGPYHYYSGMGPGILAGTYRPQDARFHIARVVRDRGGEFIQDKVVRVDAAGRHVTLASGRLVPYDVASFNTGSYVPMGALHAEGERHVYPVKPIENLIHAQRRILAWNGKRAPRLVVLGGGAGGVETCANIWRLCARQGGAPDLSLITGGETLSTFPAALRAIARDSLAARGVKLLENRRVVEVSNGKVGLADGGAVPYDIAILATGIRPHGLFRDSGLPTSEDGGLLVNEYLQSVDHGGLFGGGDCVAHASGALARVGVYAVRQNPILLHNLLAALEGRALRRFDSGGAYLLILNMGDGRGLLWKRRLKLHNRLAFAFKDFLDRRFMKRFQVCGEREEAFDFAQLQVGD